LGAAIDFASGFLCLLLLALTAIFGFSGLPRWNGREYLKFCAPGTGKIAAVESAAWTTTCGQG
jgi:hypothetical protein